MFQASLSAVIPHARGVVHEVRAPAGTAAHSGFALLILAASPGIDVPVVWASTAPNWYPPGLAFAGLDPARCLFAQGRDDAENLGTLEVALRGGFTGVAECGALSRLAARRLALAARQGGGVGILLRHAPVFTREDSTAVATRWMVQPAPGNRLRAERLYAKAAQPGVFMLDLLSLEEKTHAATPNPVPVAAPGQRRAG